MLLVIASTACGRQAVREASGAEPPSVAALVVDTATVSIPLSFPAQLYVEHDAAVAARSAGVIDSLLVDIGTRVGTDDLLAKIESTDQEIALARAEATLDNSERMVARARSLSQVRGMTVADSEQ